jgi:hypothetical protein
MARALYTLVSILLFPLLLANLSICAWSTATAMDLTADSSLLLWIVSLLIALFFWFSATAARRVLKGEAPAWLRVLWLPGLIGMLWRSISFSSASRYAPTSSPPRCSLRASSFDSVIVSSLSFIR